jgi:hypothetical protein
VNGVWSSQLPRVPVGDFAEVCALVFVEPQRQGHRVQHGSRRGYAALLQAGVVVDADAGELRDFLAA